MRCTPIPLKFSNVSFSPLTSSSTFASPSPSCIIYNFFFHFFTFNQKRFCFTSLSLSLSLSLPCAHSVTRFGKISPLWQKISLGRFVWGVCYVIGIVLGLLWQEYYYCSNFHCCKRPNVEKITQPSSSGHTARSSHFRWKINFCQK